VAILDLCPYTVKKGMLIYFEASDTFLESSELLRLPKNTHEFTNGPRLHNYMHHINKPATISTKYSGQDST
jgi:hypothetical protein